MKKRYFALMSLAVVAMFSLAACSQAEEPTSTPVTFEPTASGGSATATPTSSSEATATPGTTPTEPSGGGGDATNGEALFASNSCNACHSTGSNSVVGPGLAGLYDRAGSTVDGLSADEYVEQSIKEPNEFVVDGFPAAMSPFAGISDSDLADLQAYLKTLN